MQTNPLASPKLAFLSLAFAVLLWALPMLHVVFDTHLQAHDFTRLGELVFIAVAGAVWAMMRRTTGPMQGRDVWPAGALILLVAASSIQAVYPWMAVREVALIGGLFIAALALSVPLSDPLIRDRFLDVLTIGGAVYGAVWLSTFIMAGVVAVPFSPWEMSPGFDNARFLNHAQTVAVPLSGVALLRENSPRWLRRVSAFSLFVSGAILALYLGRASILGLLAGAIAATWLIGRPSRRYVASMVIWLSAGAMAMGAAWLLWYGHLVAEMSDSVLSTHFRGYLALRAVDLFRTSPWLGVGPMHFAHHVNPIAAHPHNVYAQVLAEYGAPAFLVIAWCAIRGLWVAARSLRALIQSQPALAGALTAATVAMLVDGMFSGSFVMPMSQLWCVVLIALLMGTVRGAKIIELGGSHEPDRSTRNVGRRAGRGVLAAVLVVAMTVAFGEARFDDSPRLQTGGPKVDAVGYEAFNPRFWAHGWF
ncbi:O-antigen ligase family protein [Roseateles chitinivorans]|uniref:O-antigen ligase family protein n=1 Tax=Roseateles chitinivorans TaxID=2917965 RepID=UPI003D67EF1F